MSSNYGDGAYRVELFERAPGETDRSKRAEVVDTARVRAERALNSIAAFAVDIPVPAADSDQDRLRSCRVWRYEVDIWRDEDLIYSGVITRIRHTRTALYLTGFDPIWWLDHRFVRARLAFEDEADAYGTRDATVIAQLAASSALAPDDPGLMSNMILVPGSVAQGRYELVDRASAYEVWEDLISQGMDFTALGRRIIASSGEIEVPPLPVMSDGDFAGELEVIEDGEEGATRVAVCGGGLVGTAGDGDSYYGLVEKRFNATAEITTQAILDKAAADHLAVRNPPPLLIQIPSDGQLSPTCSVRPPQLIPGALGVIQVGYTLRPVSQQMRLAGVAFEKNGANAEQVSVQFQPVGPLAERAS